MNISIHDPMQMMMGLMLGKSLMGVDYHEKENAASISATSSPLTQKSLESKTLCASCGQSTNHTDKFCPQCGKGLV
jgi:membrane protease subunit (stomatin/prohibitin family)